MLHQFRRVVTGHDAQGRSIIESNEIVDNTHSELPYWPGMGGTGIWMSPSAPANNEVMPDLAAGFAWAAAGSGGVWFNIMQIAPDADLKSMTAAQRALAERPVARLFPQAFEIDTSKSSYAMHATDTLDLLIMLSGELTLLVDEGEVTLKPFDTVIQRGVNHGWVNRGATPALIASATIDAKPLKRKHPGRRGVDVAAGLGQSYRWSAAVPKKP
jgi:naringenin degradation protein FdeH